MNVALLTDDNPYKEFPEKVFKAAWETIDLSTVPICFYREGTLMFDRTGVLLQIGEMRFLVTAAHIGDDGKTLLDARAAGFMPYILMSEIGLRPVPVISERHMTTKNDNEDITVFMLHPEAASRLATHYQFVRLDKVMSRDDKFHTDAVYLLSGFPIDMESKNPTDKHVKSWYYLTLRYDGSGENIKNYDPNIHIAIKYRKTTHDRDGKTVHPPGMSGCGIWFVGNPLTWDLFSARDFRLVGIQTAWHSGHEYAKGTWIDLVLYIIWRYWSDTRDVMRFYGIDFSAFRL